MSIEIPGITVRGITEDEFPSWARVDATAFLGVQTDQQMADARLTFEVNRALGAFEGAAQVGTAGAYSLGLTLPGGGVLPVAGVTAVGVLPTHRRRGVLRQMMATQLDDVAGRGEAVAILGASESSIYGRFGYGVASFGQAWSLATERARWLHPPTVTPALRLVTADEAGRLLPERYDRYRPGRPGRVSWSPGGWQRYLLDRDPGDSGSGARFFVVGDDGFAIYRIRDHWEQSLPASELRVELLEAADPETEAAMWQFLFAIDLVATVVAENRPVDETLRWRLLEPRRLRVTEQFDELYVRVLDVAVALEARRYDIADRLVLEVRDGFRPQTEGCYLLEGGPDGAACRRVDQAPDLVLGVAELGSLYLGGVRASELARASRIVERTPGALRRADALFAAAPAPWCGTDF